MGSEIDLSRYTRNCEGVRNFAMLIEQASQNRRAMLINQLRTIDRKFLVQVLRKVVYFEEIIYFEEGVLAEIVAATPAITLAYALRGMPEEFRKKMGSLVGFRQRRQMLDEEEKIAEKPLTILVEGARRQLLKIARHLEDKDNFVFQLDDCPRFRTQNIKTDASKESSKRKEKLKIAA